MVLYPNGYMKYYSTKETAKILGFTDDRYVRRLIQNGRLTAQKIGNELLISQKAIDCFKQGKRLVIIYGGLIETKRGWHYYFGRSKNSMVYSQVLTNRLLAENALMVHIDATQQQFGDNYYVFLDRDDRKDMFFATREYRIIPESVKDKSGKWIPRVDVVENKKHSVRVRNWKWDSKRFNTKEAADKHAKFAAAQKLRREG